MSDFLLNNPLLQSNVNANSFSMNNVGSIEMEGDLTTTGTIKTDTILDADSNAKINLATGGSVDIGTQLLTGAGVQVTGTIHADDDLDCDGNITGVVNITATGNVSSLAITTTGDAEIAGTIDSDRHTIETSEFSKIDLYDPSGTLDLRRWYIAHNDNGTTGYFQVKARNDDGTVKLEGITLTTEGRMGVNNNSPEYTLDVGGYMRAKADGGVAIYSSRASTDSSAPVIDCRKSRGTHASPLDVVDNDYIGAFRAYGYQGGGFNRCGEMLWQVAGTVTGANIPTEWFLYCNNGSANVARLAIDVNGHMTLQKKADNWGGLTIRGEDTTADAFQIVHGAYATSGTQIQQLGNYPLRFFTNGTERGAIDGDGIVSWYSQSQTKSYRSSNFSVADTTWTHVVFQSEDRDVQGEYNNATGLFTCKDAGTYQLNTTVRVDGIVANKIYYLNVEHNGSQTAGDLIGSPVVLNYYCHQVSVCIYLTVGQTLNVAVYHNQGVTKTYYNDGRRTCLSIVKVT